MVSIAHRDSGEGGRVIGERTTKVLENGHYGGFLTAGR